MSKQQQDKVRELLLKADDGSLSDEGIDELAEETRHDHEQTYRNGCIQTHRTNERQKQKPTNRRRFFRGVRR